MSEGLKLLIDPVSASPLGLFFTAEQIELGTKQQKYFKLRGIIL